MAENNNLDGQLEPQIPGLQPPCPDAVTNSLVGRALIEFHSYLFSERRKYFATREYLDGLAEQRNQTSDRFGRSTGRAVITCFLLIGYVGGVKFELPLLENYIVQFPAVIELITFLASLMLMQVVVTFLDYVIVEQMLDTLARHELNIQSPKFAYAHKSSIGIWIEILNSSREGYRSGLGHVLVAGTVGIFFGLYLLALILFCFGVIIFAFHYVVVEGHSTSITFNLLS